MIDRCHWCNGEYEKKIPQQRFCQRKCKEAHWRARNREKLNERSKQWTIDNPMRSAEIKKKYNDAHTEEKHEWYEKNKSELLVQMNITADRKKIHSRIQAKRIVKRLGWERKCFFTEQCNGRIELHHKDKNALNNEIENLIYLCKKHHMEQHSRLGTPLPATV